MTDFYLGIRWIQVLRTRQTVRVTAGTLEAAVELLQQAIDGPYEADEENEEPDDGFGITLRINGTPILVERPNEILDDDIRIENSGFDREG